MNNNLTSPNIRIFVFGTLRKGGRLDFYMEGSKFDGMYYTRGQLMKSEMGSAYIDMAYDKAHTIGELYHVNFYCLQRINHLESVSGEFPTGYDIDLIPIWPYDKNKPVDFPEQKKELALFYRRRSEPVKIMSGDWVNRTTPIREIEKYLVGKRDVALSENNILEHIIDYLNYNK
ncbi:MAG: gamma-glutamylcyclotransferase [Bacteroidales bacterium]|nr:gamma-glutamylcyclotransferase [Bacteroidales bacterium]